MGKFDEYLDGVDGGYAPEEWMVSRTCEAFGCPPVPGGALDQPNGLTSRILFLRAFQGWKARIADPHAQEGLVVPDWMQRLTEALLLRRLDLED